MHTLAVSAFFVVRQVNVLKTTRNPKDKPDLNGKPNKRTRYNKTKQTDKI